MKAGSPLAAGQPPSLREVGDLPLISYRTCSSSHQVEEQLRLRGSSPEIVFRSDDNGTMQGMVAAGVGVALMPALAVDLADPRTRAVDMSGKLPPRLIGDRVAPRPRAVGRGPLVHRSRRRGLRRDRAASVRRHRLTRYS